jgi:hypothetical protein
MAVSTFSMCLLREKQHTGENVAASGANDETGSGPLQQHQADQHGVVVDVVAAVDQRCSHTHATKQQPTTTKSKKKTFFFEVLGGRSQRIRSGLGSNPTTKSVNPNHKNCGTGPVCCAAHLWGGDVLRKTQTHTDTHTQHQKSQKPGSWFRKKPASTF